MKKKLFGIIICVVLMLSMSVVAFAAGSIFPVRYLPGTNDTNVFVPSTEQGIGGETFNVSSKVPMREGYEFLGWTLDYDIAETCTLTYEVAGDPNFGKPGDVTEPMPVTGIVKGSSVTLSEKLASTWRTSDGSALEDKANCSIYYYEAEKDNPFDQETKVDLTVGSKMPIEAKTFEGYKISGSDSQIIEIKPNTVGTWTFTGWCSDEECTTPITELTDITADTTVYGKWTYSEIHNNNEISFYYDKLWKYYVYYRAYGRGDIADMKIGYALPHKMVDEYPVAVDGYMRPAWIRDEISSDGYEISFFYLPLY